MCPSRINRQKIHILIFSCMLLVLLITGNGYGADAFSGKWTAGSYQQEVQDHTEYPGIMNRLFGLNSNSSYDVHPDILQTHTMLGGTAGQACLVGGLVVCIVMLVVNIIRRRQTETALQDSREILNSALASLDDYIFVLDSRGVLVDYYQSTSSPLLNDSYREVLNRSYREVMPTAVVELLDGVLERVRNSGESEQVICHLDTPRGKRSYRVDVSVRKGAAHRQKGFIVTASDITGDAEAGEALLRSEAQYRFLTEKMNDMIWIIDLNFKTTFVSPSIEKVLGFTVEERLNQDPMTVLTPESYAKAREVFARELERDHEEGIDPDRSITFHAEYYHKDGSTVWTENMISAIRDKDGDIVGIHGVSRDITRNRKIELQLRQAQKMEALGTLAGGIAHDFNNILSAIIGFTELAQNYAAQESKVQKNLQEVLRAGMRARDLVKQILTFSRQVEGKRIPVQVHLIVKEALNLIRSTIPSTIEVREHVDNKVDMVLADPTQIHQVIMNLCTNAYQAMDEHGGILEVRLERIDMDSDVTRDHPGRHIRLSVSDTGVGMERKTVERIFDPFFSTKDRDKGTGLGLATVHGIVTSLGGNVDVESTPGKGSVFNVYLPCIEQEVPCEQPVIKATSKGQGERILLVDDEEPLVQIEKEMLEELGYTVIPKTNSKDAFTTFRTQSDLFDLIITDMTMPGLTGMDLSRMVLQIKPDTPIILCTGFSDKVNKERALELGIKEYLEKPFNKDVFAQTVNRVLNNRGAREENPRTPDYDPASSSFRSTLS